MIKKAKSPDESTEASCRPRIRSPFAPIVARPVIKKQVTILAIWNCSQTDIGSLL